jgi:hypothetical protein
MLARKPSDDRPTLLHSPHLPPATEKSILELQDVTRFQRQESRSIDVSSQCVEPFSVWGGKTSCCRQWRCLTYQLWPRSGLIQELFTLCRYITGPPDQCSHRSQDLPHLLCARPHGSRGHSKNRGHIPPASDAVSSENL